MEYIKKKNKKIKINTLTNFKEKFKSIRFKLDTITEGYFLKKKKGINTYFFCQRVNIYQLDENNKIIRCYLNIKTEKFVFRKRDVRNILILPSSVNDYFKQGDVIAFYS